MEETTPEYQTRVSAKDDYMLFSLQCNLYRALHLVINYMQDVTAYGEAYKAAFAKYEEILKQIGELDRLLKDCAKARKSK